MLRPFDDRFDTAAGLNKELVSDLGGWATPNWRVKSGKGEGFEDFSVGIAVLLNVGIGIAS